VAGAHRQPEAQVTAPVIVQPDLEAWVWSQVKHLPGVTLFAYAAVQMWPGWVYAHSIQVDARAKTKQAARDLAEQVRQIVCSLPDRLWPDGVISYVQPVEGPFWLPDDDGVPRYCARYEVRVHPNRRAAPAPLIGAADRRRPASPARTAGQSGKASQ
jgi:Bacteriophage minor capsid protein